MSEYKLVPVDPTSEMVAAGRHRYEMDEHLSITQVYRAMIAAAPAVSAEPVGWVYGNSFWEKGNPRLPDDAKRYGRPLYAHPPAPAVAWQPISTAPKDVERLLVWCETDDGGDVFLLHQTKRGQWLYDGQPLYALPFWMEAKYWMPLPTPPNGGAE